MMTILDVEIDEHLAATNHYFQQTNYTLDDLNVYSEPFANAHHALMHAAEGRISRHQAVGMFLQAIEGVEALHETMNAEYDAA